MARTHGHGNPPWSRDETILALDLYHQANGTPLPRNDRRVQALSVFLRNLPYSRNKSRNDTYRNPDSVAFKLLNIRAVATGKGLNNVSSTDRAVWRELGAEPTKVRRLASLIRRGAAISETLPVAIDQDEGEEFEEGRTLTLWHKTRERNRKIRQKLLAKKRRAGALTCELCGLVSSIRSRRYEDAAFEAHHLIPISQSLQPVTRLSDMALLCANCHRLLHRAISLEGRWLNLSEARQIIGIA